ncbi:Asparagine synthase, partial [Cynara cardunculus var. scolymus]
RSQRLLLNGTLKDPNKNPFVVLGFKQRSEEYQEMCGIALIISGVRIDLSSLLLDTTSCSSSSQEPATFCLLVLHCNYEEYILSLNLWWINLGIFLYITIRVIVLNEEMLCKNFLLYLIGEVFGGIELSSDSNDAEVLMQYLGKCCNCLSHNREGACSSSGNGKYSVPELLSTIKGPWALIYWQASSKTIWFGRDALGRRSLLVHWPSTKDSRFMLSSVSPPSAIDERAVYSLSMSALKLDENLVGEVRRHNWTDPMLEELIKWERTYVEPRPEDLIESHGTFSSEQQGHLHQEVLAVLKESVRRRTIFSGTHLGNSPVAVLFSGGLDSMILAALLDECLDLEFGIDLLNVSFDGQSAPDRISARAGVIELRKKASLRRWNLVEIDAELPKLTLETKHVMSLINPSNTYMDLNIGIALWLAAGGDGWVCEEIGRNDDSEHHRFKYKSDSRILLVGSGADEQYLGQPSGVGDKKILREFGSRIARESNRKNFGSNRAANQASAGSALIHPI